MHYCSLLDRLTNLLQMWETSEPSEMQVLLNTLLVIHRQSRDGLLPGTQTKIDTELASKEGHLGKIWWDKMRHQFPELFAP